MFRGWMLKSKYQVSIGCWWQYVTCQKPCNMGHFFALNSQEEQGPFKPPRVAQTRLFCLANQAWLSPSCPCQFSCASLAAFRHLHRSFLIKWCSNHSTEFWPWPCLCLSWLLPSARRTEAVAAHHVPLLRALKYYIQLIRHTLFQPQATSVASVILPIQASLSHQSKSVSTQEF